MKKTRIKVKVAALQLNEGQLPWLPKNPRQWTQSDIDRTVESLRQDPDFLEDRPLDIVPAPQKGEFVVFCGNLRTTALGINGTAETDAYLYEPERATLEEDRETIRRRAIKDNGQYGSWDSDELANWGYEAAELAGFGVPGFVYGEVPGGGEGGEEPGGGDNHHAQEDDFDENSDEIHVRCKPGDIWELGEHRLMCGDSVDLQQVKALMGGARADMVFTSPPYNAGHLDVRKSISRGGGVQESTKKKYLTDNDQKPDEEYQAFLIQNISVLLECAKEVFYNIGIGRGSKKAVAKLLWEYRDKFKELMYWVKDNPMPVIAKGVVSSATELIICFGNNGTRSFSCFDDRLFHGVVYGHSAACENQYADIHKATFPVYLPSEFISRFTPIGGSVLDCFGGTGTTLIAAEQLGRKCYTMEIDPHYCDVIIARWEKLTGKTAVKVN